FGRTVGRAVDSSAGRHGSIDAGSPGDDPQHRRIPHAGPLQQRKFAVGSQAGDIETALERLQNDPSINLLLTDVGLPRMNGRELADVARGWREGLPILFMTGYAETAINRQVFLGAGMEMLVKPFQIRELLDKVRRTLDGA
ncbi:response regulator, partial [Pseudomonas syringae]